MRIGPFIISALVTGGLIYGLNKKWGSVPPMGKFLSPQHGFWQNAEPADKSFDADLSFSGLKGKAEVFFDERLVPHIFAEQETDAYFIQGYLHAKFRLWQMEFQTHAAAGRISEIIGERAIDYDKGKRRLGMVFGAQNMLREIEKDPRTKSSVDAYTAGVNAWIESLSESELPIEYKLLDYKPEPWTNLKSALFIKEMSNTLAGYEEDFERTNALRVLGEKAFTILYPEVPDSLAPIVPKGTLFSDSAIIPSPPANADSVYFHRSDSVWFTGKYKPRPDNGSNNWAVSGSKTRSGYPILCNDPHLSLTLPSIWYEIQISVPEYNTYGVSFPGIPGVVIGFNENIAFGFTNSQRDVKDYYEIRFRDETRQEYWFNSTWRKTDSLKTEIIKVRGKEDVLDTVAYTLFGPVMYDKSFGNKLNDGKAYAVRWTAHDPANILLMWYLLNRAKDYNDYYEAIQHFNCPGQNMIFASKKGDIALWQQAAFPLRWQRQGEMIMPGFDSSYMWQGFIPYKENPHVINPERGFIQSANQRPADSTYPYYIPGHYDVYRGIMIDRLLNSMNNITPEDMMAMHSNNYNVFAEMAMPLLLRNVNAAHLTPGEKKYLELARQWNYKNEYNETGATVFMNWWDSLQVTVLGDELGQGPIPLIYPSRFSMLEGLLKDSGYLFIDNIHTDKKESLQEDVTLALKKAAVALKKLEEEGKLEWGKYKNTTVYHLLRESVMPFARTGLPIGGGVNIINATQHDHGPSWRMVVHLTEETEAYAVYPGGQSGNPGSPYYDNFVDQWAAGKYYRLWVMKEADKNNEKIKWKMKFTPRSSS